MSHVSSPKSHISHPFSLKIIRKYDPGHLHLPLLWPRTNPTCMKRRIILFGLLAGLLVSAFFLGPVAFADWENMDMSRGEFFGYLTMVLCMMLVPVGQLVHRKRDLGGRITFGRAMGLGGGIVLLATVVFYIANVLLYEVINPNFLESFAVAYEKFLAADPAKAEALQQYLDNKDFWMNGWVYAGVMAGSVMAIGVLVTLVSSGVLALADRRKAA